MSSADQIGDRGVEREVTMQARLPTAVFAVLLLFMCVAVGVMGYAYPVTGRNRPWASALLFMLLIITLLLIIDLDRPAGGSIVIEQEAMKDLVADFRSNSVRPFGYADRAVRGMEAQR
jgi:membrane protein YdbS with pleckstrin-like domain